jgi:hypothetical protein
MISVFSVGLLSVEKFRLFVQDLKSSVCLFKTFGFEETPLIHGQKDRRTEANWGLELGDIAILGVLFMRDLAIYFLFMIIMLCSILVLLENRFISQVNYFA